MAENAAKRAQTKSKLKAALIELCQETGYYNVTVLDICRQAGMYRSTFYRYYDTKDEVLREIEHEYIEAVRGLTPTLWSIHADASSEDMAQYRRELTADMEYHREHQAVCKFLLSPAGDLTFYRMMVESIGQYIKMNLQKYGTKDAKTMEYLTSFFAAGFVSTIEKWLKSDDCPPSEIAEFLLNMIIELQ